MAMKRLITDDFLFTKGNRDEMIGRLQIKLGKTKEDLEKIFAAL